MARILLLLCTALLVALHSARALAVPAGSAAAQSGELRVLEAGDGALLVLRAAPEAGPSEAILVDSNKLVETLKARVLEARGLAEVAQLRPSSRTLISAVADARRSDGKAPTSELAPRNDDVVTNPPYVFSHTFAAPFASLHATLRLRPLADPDDGALAAKLALIVPVCVLAALAALYRMAAAQVEFAERRTNFVSAVSHELKTPLTAIRMHAEMLDADLVEDAGKRREYYGTITRESERLSRLIDNVLTFAQLERETRKLPTYVGDVSSTIRESVEVLRPHVEAHGFSIRLEIPDTVRALPDVRFEPDALKQVLFNLVDNALKYGRESGDRRIIVRCEAKDGSVVLSVRDHGPGVRREHLDAVFEPFFRGEHELTRKNQGTGIGLALVKGLGQAMGARVRAENQDPGFCVSLFFSPS